MQLSRLATICFATERSFSNEAYLVGLGSIPSIHPLAPKVRLLSFATLRGNGRCAVRGPGPTGLARHSSAPSPIRFPGHFVTPACLGTATSRPRHAAMYH